MLPKSRERHEDQVSSPLHSVSTRPHLPSSDVGLPGRSLNFTIKIAVDLGQVTSPL